MKASHILGINARNHLYLSRYNRRRGKEIADSKLLTKRFLRRLKLPHPRLIAKFERPADVARFDWGTLGDNFVIKPAAGYAGGGILIIRKRLSPPATSATKGLTFQGQTFSMMDGTRADLGDLRLHILDILAGRYDRYNLPDVAIIEERVVRHPKFHRYAYKGTPDVRVIMFNQVPVMAALRLPTPESRGRANIHQGAIMAGIDLATGITTDAAHWDRPIYRVPETNLKLNGIQIPHWDQILALAVETQQRISLGYLAVDFLIDPEKGPLVVELTARPGLGIQIANMSGLRRRIERVEGLDIAPGRGIEVAKALFAERFADKVLAEKGVKVVNVFEPVRVRGVDGKKVEVSGKVDTGAYRSSIDRELAKSLGLLKDRSILWRYYYVSSLGREQRPVIPVTLWLAGRKIETTANVSDRSKLKAKVLVGRRDLSTFVVRVGEEQ